MARILLTQAIHPVVQASLAEFGEVRVAADTLPDTLRRDASGCSVVVVRAPLPDDIFDAAPSLVGAVRHGAGVDMIPVEAATARGVLVANVPGANAHTVAEHVLWSLLHLARRRSSMLARLQTGPAGWAAARALADSGFELPGRTIGLVGFGHVGQAIARLCSGLSMHVLAHSRSGPRAGAPAAERPNQPPAHPAEQRRIIFRLGFFLRNRRQRREQNDCAQQNDSRMPPNILSVSHDCTSPGFSTAPRARILLFSPRKGKQFLARGGSSR